MLRRQVLHFAIAGSLGFVLDAGLVQLLSGPGGWDPLLARVLSVAAAIAFTFAYNRHITFADRRSARIGREFGRYLLGNAAGLATNYGAFVLCLALWPLLRQWPAIGVAVGSLAGMGVNFVAARYFVFARSSLPD